MNRDRRVTRKFETVGPPVDNLVKVFTLCGVRHSTRRGVGCPGVLFLRTVSLE